MKRAVSRKVNLPLVFHDKSAAVYKILPHSPEGNQEKKAK
jgi:hypothetical protein